jgi:hypothetical protein
VPDKQPIRRSDLPARLRTHLDELEPRVQRNVVAITIWENSFSPAERKQLGDDPYLAWKHNGRTAGMWAAVRGVSKDRAIIDIAHALDWLDTKTCKALLKALGEGATASGTPRWLARTGELWFEGRIVRRIRNQAKASTIVRILDAFELCGWPTTIDDPVTAGGDSAQRRRAVESLNDGLERIRFACAGDGESFRWDVVPRRKRTATAKKKAAKKRS